MGGNGGGHYDWGKMILAVTNRCNLSCKMCWPVRQPKHTLPEDVAMHCVEFAERRGFHEVEVSGGEPTLIDYVWRLLDRLCAVKGLEAKITTNGAALSEDQIAALAKYPDLVIQVSIDGIGETHDAIRGVNGAFDRSVEALENLAAAGCRHLSINTVVQRSNLDQMPQLYERLKHLPLRFHAFSLIEGLDFCDEQMLHPEENEEVVQTLREVKRRGDADGRDVILSEDLLQAFGRQVRYPAFQMHPGIGCSVVRKGLVITHEGFAVPCYHFPWVRDDRRSLQKHTLDEIVESEEVRRELSAATKPLGCRGCSTMCYNWDEEFRQKVMRPSGRLRLRQKLVCGREDIKRRFPQVLHLYRLAKYRLGLKVPPGFPQTN